jgi:hypothetical protein
MRDAQLGEQRRLPCLRELELVRSQAVQDGCAGAIEVGEVMQRLEDRARVPARPGRRAHSVHEERIARLRIGGIEDELCRIDALVRQPAPVELGEQRLEPLWVLVEDADRAHRLPQRGRAEGHSRNLTALPRVRFK